MDPFLPSYSEEFVGQSAAVSIAKLTVQAARKGKRPPHLLVHGPVGCGKSALGRLLAIELDHPWLPTVGAALETTKEMREFLQRLSRIPEEKLLVQVDEANGMGKSSAEMLHSVLDSDLFHAGHPVQLPQTMWYFTPNFPSSVPDSILSRCTVLSFEPIL